MATKYPVANRSFPVWIEGREYKVYVISRYNDDLPTSAYNTMIATCFRQWAHIMATIASGVEEPTGDLDTSAWQKITANDEPYPCATDEPYVTVWGHPSGSGITVTVSEQVTTRQAWNAVQSLRYGLALFEQHADKLGVSFVRPTINANGATERATDHSGGNTPNSPQIVPKHKEPNKSFQFRKIEILNADLALLSDFPKDGKEPKSSKANIASIPYDYRREALFVPQHSKIVYGVSAISFNAEAQRVEMRIHCNSDDDMGKRATIFRYMQGGNEETFDFKAIAMSLSALGWDGNSDWGIELPVDVYMAFKVSSKGEAIYWNFYNLYTPTGLLPD